jgi:hypothetical protein
MKAIMDFFYTIQRMLGMTNSIRSTVNSVKRESKNVSKFVESKKKKQERNEENTTN